MSHLQHSYSLTRTETSWRWSVLNEEGEVVASGAAPDQADADRTIFDVLERLSHES